MIVVDDGNVHILHIKIGCQWHNQKLYHRQYENDRQKTPVTEYLSELLTQYEFQYPHASRILKLFKLMVSRVRVIPASMSVSFQTAEKPVPLSMIAFTMV